MGDLGLAQLGDFSSAMLFGSIIFSAIGLGVFIYGKKNKYFRPMIIGVALMVYPYLVPSTALLYIIGIGLTAAVFIWKE